MAITSSREVLRLGMTAMRIETKNKGGVIPDYTLHFQERKRTHMVRVPYVLWRYPGGAKWQPPPKIDLSYEF